MCHCVEMTAAASDSKDTWDIENNVTTLSLTQISSQYITADAFPPTEAPFFQKSVNEINWKSGAALWWQI